MLPGSSSFPATPNICGPGLPTYPWNETDNTFHFTPLGILHENTISPIYMWQPFPAKSPHFENVQHDMQSLYESLPSGDDEEFEFRGTEVSERQSSHYKVLI